MKAVIVIPTRVRTFRVMTNGPTVMATATRSMEKGPIEEKTDVVRKSLGAPSGRKIAASLVNNPPRKSPRTRVQTRRLTPRVRMSSSSPPKATHLSRSTTYVIESLSDVNAGLSGNPVSAPSALSANSTALSRAYSTPPSSRTNSTIRKMPWSDGST